MRLTTDRVHVEEGAVAAATWFESLAVASHPLQRRPRRNYLLFIQKSTTHTQIRDPQIETRLFPNSFAATSRQFSPIQIYESEKEISKCGRGLKLARLPRSLAATLAVLPSISETPFLDSCVPAFLIKSSVSHLC